MIKDNLLNSYLYKNISTEVDLAFNIAINLNANSPLGKVIVNENLYYTVMEYYGKINEDIYEAHKNYADMQVILGGTELVGYAPIKLLNEKIPYEKEKDIMFLFGIGDYIKMQSGDFILLFPQDAHNPSIGIDAKLIKKAVFKIKLN